VFGGAVAGGAGGGDEGGDLVVGEGWQREDGAADRVALLVGQAGLWAWNLLLVVGWRRRGRYEDVAAACAVGRVAGGAAGAAVPDSA
jgi:hypothetical protein